MRQGARAVDPRVGLIQRAGTETAPGWPACFMKVRRDTARTRVPREAYLVSRMRRYRHILSVLRFTVRLAHRPESNRGTLHERRFTRKSRVSALAAEAS